MNKLSVQWRAPFSDDEVQRVHDRAFDIKGTVAPSPWKQQLDRYSLGWATARIDWKLVGFLNVVTDGGIHAWLQDVVVEPDNQQHGIGATMIELAAEKCSEAGCEWLHVDFGDDVAGFYLDKCGFRATSAGIRYLQ